MILLPWAILVFLAGIACGFYYEEKLSKAKKLKMASWMDQHLALQTALMNNEIKEFKSAIAMEIALAQKELMATVRQASPTAATPDDDDENNNNGGDKGPLLN